MYEEISLDAVESNKDEAPDYRPMLKSSSSGVPTDVNYRMKYLSTLETEEVSRYQEFARVADKEGFKKVANVFKDILRDERKHEGDINQADKTMMNLKTAIEREREKIDTIKSIKETVEESNDTKLALKLDGMVSEEKTHVQKLMDAMKVLEKEMKDIREKKNKKEEEPKEFCDHMVCVPRTKAHESIEEGEGSYMEI